MSMASELRTAFDRGRDELANALRAFPDSIPQSAAQAERSVEEQAERQVEVQDKIQEREMDV
jgi:hypothetical protein